MKPNSLFLLLITLLPFAMHAQLLQMNFDVDSTTTLVGPSPISISGSAGTLSPGAINKGLAARRNGSVPKADINMVFANNAGYWDVDNIDVTIDYQRDESAAWFYERLGNNFRFGSSGGNLQVRYSVDDGSGGQVTVNSGNIQAITNDNTFRNYRFTYDNVTGIGTVYVNSISVWTNDGPDNRDLYWTGAGNFRIGGAMDASGSVRAVIDNVYVNSLTGSSILPVELTSFNAHRLDDQTVQLMWETASEINNDYFEIQRTTDTRSWSPIATVHGAGTSSQTIEYLENDFNAPAAGIYYRIRQVDFDGTEDFSPIAFVPALRAEDQKTEVVFQTFPNPIERGNRLNLVFENLEGKDLLLVLRNMNGQEIYVKTIYISETKQYEVVELSATIPAGQYIITATSDNSVYNSRLMVK